MACQVPADLPADTLHACATLNAAGVLSVHCLNTGKQPLQTAIQLGHRHARLSLPANAVMTVRLQL